MAEVVLGQLVRMGLNRRLFDFLIPPSRDSECLQRRPMLFIRRRARQQAPAHMLIGDTLSFDASRTATDIYLSQAKDNAAVELITEKCAAIDTALHPDDVALAECISDSFQIIFAG
jgi:hypothetical protein